MFSRKKAENNIPITIQLERVSGRNGGVFQNDREEEILDTLAPGRDLAGDRLDRWSNLGNEGSVSIEHAGGKELDMKDALDGKQVAQNLGWDTADLEGLVPCDLLEKAKSNKKWIKK